MNNEFETVYMQSAKNTDFDDIVYGKMTDRKSGKFRQLVKILEIMQEIGYNAPLRDRQISQEEDLKRIKRHECAHIVASRNNLKGLVYALLKYDTDGKIMHYMVTVGIDSKERRTPFEELKTSIAPAIKERSLEELSRGEISDVANIKRSLKRILKGDWGRKEYKF